jgi:hypothetical protein
LEEPRRFTPAGLFFGRDDYRKLRARAGLEVPDRTHIELQAHVLIAASPDHGGF